MKTAAPQGTLGTWVSGTLYQSGLEVQLHAGAGAAGQDLVGRSVLFPPVHGAGLSCTKVRGKPGSCVGMSV